MSQDLKTQVLAFLHNLPEEGYEQFNQAFELYKKLPNRNKGSEVSYNRQGYKEQTLKNLLYDLKKLCGITDVEVLEGPKETENEVIELATSDKITLGENVLKFANAFNTLDEALQKSTLIFFKFIEVFGEEVVFNNIQIEEYFENIPQIIKSITPEIEESERETFADDLALYFKGQLDLISDLEFPEDLENILLENKNVLQLVPAELPDDNFIKELDHNPAHNILGNKELPEFTELRTEFPFLNEKNCPDILFVVVGKRIAAFKEYQKLHAQLQNINSGIVNVTPEEKLDATENTERAFNENKLLWDELNYYNLNKEILGKHPLFRETNIKREVEAMTMDEMVKFNKNSVKYFHDQKAALIKHKDDAVKLEAVHRKITDRNYKLALVNAKLGVNAGEKK